jgi:hypothetical protein
MARYTQRHLPIISAAVLGAALLAALPARAAEDPGKEVATAATHAGLATAAKDMKAVQMHLHHTVNCLVGPSGAGFDAKEANPCKDQGNGAIPDTKDPGKLAALRDALTKANDGLTQSDMATAQKDAAAAQALIKNAM